MSTDREIRAGRLCDARNDREIQSGDINEAKGERKRERERVVREQGRGFLSLTRPCVSPVLPLPLTPSFQRGNFSGRVAPRYPDF